MAETIKTNKLIWDKETFARSHTSDNTIAAYVASLSIGATFPPIKVEKLINYPGHEGEVISIRDGYHRWKAHIKAEKEEIEIEYWTTETLDYSDRKVKLILKAKSAKFNKEHGDRIPHKDLKDVAQWMAENDPEKEWTEEMLSDELGVPQQTINEWISDIRAKQRASRNSIIYRLHRLGWTQEDIGTIVKLNRSRVAQIVNFTDSGKINDFLQQDIPEDKVNELIKQALQDFKLDVPLAWSIRMDGQSDPDRFGLAPSSDDAHNLKWGPYPYDVWNFGQCDKRFGDSWPGRIPAQIVGHVLYFYTEQSDLVMDPMAGGGVVPDVCLALNRKCRAFDVIGGLSDERTNKRPEIEYWYWELGNMRWPTIKKPDLILFDPPYFNKKDKEYSDKLAEQETEIKSLSSLPRDDYLEFFREWFSLAIENIAKDSKLAFIMSDWNDDDGNGIFIWDYADLLHDTGWKIIRHIQIPLPPQIFSGDFVNKFRESKKLGRLERYILIAERA